MDISKVFEARTHAGPTGSVNIRPFFKYHYHFGNTIPSTFME